VVRNYLKLPSKWGPQLSSGLRKSNGMAWSKNFQSKCFSLNQGCQMVYFETKNPTLGKFCLALK
jgi:hypothetical protein